MSVFYKIQLTKKELQARRQGGVYFSKVEEPMLRQGVLTPKTKKEALKLIGVDLCKVDLRGLNVLDTAGNPTAFMGCVGVATVDINHFKNASDETLFTVDVILSYDFNKTFNERFTTLANTRYIIDIALIKNE